jgi:hypothetical protein
MPVASERGGGGGLGGHALSDLRFGCPFGNVEIELD